MLKKLLLCVTIKTIFCFYFIQGIKDQNSKIGVPIQDKFGEELLLAVFFPGIPFAIFSLIFMLFIGIMFQKKTV